MVNIFNLDKKVEKPLTKVKNSGIILTYKFSKLLEDCRRVANCDWIALRRISFS